MIYLFIVSLIWAFSFGLIKNQLAALDANFIAAARLAISLLVFLPFLRLRGISRKLALQLGTAGAIQFGVMYIAYTYSFRYLQAYEVALFTIFTPLYVTLINDAFRRRFNALSLFATLLAIAGTAVVKQANLFQPGLLTGFLVVQVSNLAFAFGQVYYREVLRKTPEVTDRSVFGLLYLGGTIAALLPALFTTPWSQFRVDSAQLLTLLYLGAVASGLGFFLWNVGARKVNAGALAIFNDLKIPLAVAVSLIVFGEKANLPSLLLGGGIVLAALVINEIGVRRMSRVVEQPPA